MWLVIIGSKGGHTGQLESYWKYLTVGQLVSRVGTKSG